MSNLYFIECPEVGLFKIGITCDVDRRFKELQASSSYDLKIVRVFRCESVFAAAWEKYVHRMFGYCRTHGEWFALTIEEIFWMPNMTESLESAPLDQYHDCALRKV